MDNEYNLTSEQITELAKLSRDDLCAVIVQKYSDLVWYARKRPRKDGYWEMVPKDIRDRVMAGQMEVEKKHPLEVSRLYQDDNFHHGFNSGVLATVRVLWGWDDCEETLSVQDTRECSIEEFPCLDT